MSETLVEALDRVLDEAGACRDDFGDHAFSTIGIANYADPIFTTIARFASPEAKREVLRTLLQEERARCVALDEGHRSRQAGGEEVLIAEWMPVAATIERIDAVMAVLAPLEAP